MATTETVDRVRPPERSRDVPTGDERLSLRASKGQCYRGTMVGDFKTLAYSYAISGPDRLVPIFFDYALGAVATTAPSRVLTASGS